MSKQRNPPSDDFENDASEESFGASSDYTPIYTSGDTTEFDKTEQLRSDLDWLRQKFVELDYRQQIVDQLKELVKVERLEINQSRPTPELQARLNVLLNSYPKTWQ